MTPSIERVGVNALAVRLHAALPQTQCTRCGFPDCAGYAQAIAEGVEDINQCPPGGAEGIARLADLTGRPAPRAVNPANGVEGTRAVAVIDEAWCIGCTLCIDVCPTDAIIGSNKLMHSVLEPYCTGCELCLPVCPVDCIAMETVSGERTGWAAWSAAAAAQALERYQSRCDRRSREAAGQQRPGDAMGSVRAVTSVVAVVPVPGAGNADADAQAKLRRAVIDAALARARALRVPPH